MQKAFAKASQYYRLGYDGLGQPPSSIDGDEESDSETAALSGLKDPSVAVTRRLKHNERKLPIASILHWFSHGLALIIITALTLTVYRSKLHYQSLCAARHSTWTPASEAMGDKYRTTHFEGTFAKWTPYKGPPTDEVEMAWKRITDDVPLLNVTTEDMVSLGRSLDSVKYPSDLGEGYLGILEVTHQLHCLKKVWEDHHLEYYSAAATLKKDRPLFYEQHYEHCIDIIRQRLMCTADTGIVTFRWVKGVHGPYPDFNTAHQCRSWGDLMEFAHEREVPLDNDYVWHNEPADDDPSRLNSVP